MPTFPTLSSGSMKVASSLASSAIAMYPSTLQSSFITRSVRFLGDQEQRWTVRGKLFSASLEYHGIGGYDLSVLTAFFRTMKGSYVNELLTNIYLPVQQARP